MNITFPPAVPEIPVSDLDGAIAYYVHHLGFHLDWGSEDGDGIAGISQGQCRLFLSGKRFRERYQNAVPVVIWINLSSREEVDALHQHWLKSDAKIISPPESKPWNLYEFIAADLDGNMLRVFYDFSKDV